MQSHWPYPHHHPEPYSPPSSAKTIIAMTINKKNHQLCLLTTCVAPCPWPPPPALRSHPEARSQVPSSSASSQTTQGRSEHPHSAKPTHNPQNRCTFGHNTLWPREARAAHETSPPQPSNQTVCLKSKKTHQCQSDNIISLPLLTLV